MDKIKTAKRKHKWTEQEDKLLKELYPTPISIDEIAERLGRTRNGIIQRVNRLGITRGLKHQQQRRYFGCEEDCFNCPYPDCMKHGGFLQTY